MTGRAWQQMSAADFDADKPLTLFDIEGGAVTPVKADKTGTPDMFTAPDATGQNCPACWHLWTLHGADGCGGKVYPAHSLDGLPCPCEHTAPTAEGGQ